MIYQVAVQAETVESFDFMLGYQTTSWVEPTPAVDRHAQLVQQCSSPESDPQPLEWLYQTLDRPLQSRQAQRILLNMLELHQLRTDISLNIQQVDVAALMQSIFATHAQHAIQKGLRIELATAPHTGFIRGDQLLLHRALEHIIENAIHFTLPGGAVQIRAEEMDHHLVITVADTGIGIEAHAIPHIFEPFFRTARARHYRTLGGGLGLAISDLIIQAHGGTIDVESEVDHGSTFTISLPISS